MEMTPKLQQAVLDYRAGKAESFTCLYEESSKYIYACIYKVLSGNNNAEDLIYDMMQDTYVEISKSIRQLEDEERFLSWAGMIATRKCYAYLKKNKKYVLLNEDDNTFDTLADSDAIIPEEVMQSKEKQRLVREIIDTQLTEMQKLCIIAYYYNEQKQSEFAEALGIPENTVKTNLSRAKAKIKEGVLDLEKNKDTKLYSFAPLFLLFFTEDVMAANVPEEVGAGVLNAVADATAGTAGTFGVNGTGTGGVSGNASGVGKVGKTVAVSLKTKILGGVISVSVLGTIATGAYMMTQEVEVPDADVAYIEEYVENANTFVSEEPMYSEENLDGNPFAEGTWQNGYYGFLVADYGSDRCKGFDLHDFDEDGTPELVAIYNGGIAVFYYEDNWLYQVEEDFMFLDETTLGYGAKAAQLISLHESTFDDGRDDSSYTLYDNYQYVEHVWPHGYIEEIVSTITIVYTREDADLMWEELSYEEAQAKLEVIRSGYQKIEFKEIEYEVIEKTILNYK